MSAGELRPRVAFIDLLRLLMAVQMVQGHAIDALLGPDWRSGGAFEFWTQLRGLTAVGFLFAAGLSFAQVTRFSPSASERNAVLSRMCRAFGLIAIGYALHLPWGILTGNVEAAFREAQIVDVLQCIGISMLVLEGLHASLGSARAPWIAGVFALFVFACSIPAWQLKCEGPTRWACNYVSRSGGSLFPLLPFAGFAWIGFAVHRLLLPISTTEPKQQAARLAALSLLCGALAIGTEWVVGPAQSPLYSAWPSVVAGRLAGVYAIAAALASADVFVRAWPRWIRTLASETLTIYVAHLLALYVSIVGLARWIGPTLDPLPALLVACALLAFSFACAWIRARTRKKVGGRRAAIGQRCESQSSEPDLRAPHSPSS